MGFPRTRGISARISDEVYMALCDQAKAGGITVSTCVARLLETACEGPPGAGATAPGQADNKHGWVSAEGGLGFLVPTPEVVQCPGCGAEGRHLWLCWHCGQYLLAECPHKGSCIEGWPLEEFKVEPNEERSSHLTPGARPPLASPCDARGTST